MGGSAIFFLLFFPFYFSSSSSFFSSSSLFSSPSIVVPRPRPVPHSRALGRLVDLLPLPLASPLPSPPTTTLPLPLLRRNTIECRSRGRTATTGRRLPARGSSPHGSPARHRGQPELSAAHVPPDTYAATGGILTLHTADGMVSSLLMTQ